MLSNIAYIPSILSTIPKSECTVAAVQLRCVLLLGSWALVLNYKRQWLWKFKMSTMSDRITGWNYINMRGVSSATANVTKLLRTIEQYYWLKSLGVEVIMAVYSCSDINRELSNSGAACFCYRRATALQCARYQVMYTVRTCCTWDIIVSCCLPTFADVPSMIILNFNIHIDASN